jgi:2Fe-2S ferredoxin
LPKLVFLDAGRDRRTEVEAAVGSSILDVAHQYGIGLEGACEGMLSCSTCHVVVDPDWYRRLAPAREEEEDLLDLAFGLEPTSRLGCQIRVTEELDGLTVRLPTATRNVMPVRR